MVVLVLVLVVTDALVRVAVNIVTQALAKSLIGKNTPKSEPHPKS